jgi:tyrosinase
MNFKAVSPTVSSVSNAAVQTADEDHTDLVYSHSGLHASGHFAIGGDSGDLYSSPNEPAFFMHHAMLDRVWWIWQALHLNQTKSVMGSRLLSDPNGPRTTLEDIIETNWLNVPNVKISDVMSTLSGEPLCYIYL